MTKVIFTEVIYLGNGIERNRIDFPKQIRIKRKYLLVVRQVPIRCRIGAGGVVRCAEARRTVVSYGERADNADDGRYGAAEHRRED